MVDKYRVTCYDQYMENSTNTIQADLLVPPSPSVDIPVDAWRQLGELARETSTVVMWAMLDTSYRPRALVR